MAQALALWAVLLPACLSHTRGDDAGSGQADGGLPDAHVVPLDACACVDVSSPLPEVGAALSSVTLADDCPADMDGDCAIGGCLCQQTSLQLQFTAPAVGDDVAIQIVSVSLFTEGGAFLQNLVARDPRVFGDEGYVAWGETIHAGEDLHAAYDATSPDWAVIDPDRRFGTRYRVQVVVRIGGVERTLELSPVMRQTELDT